MKTRGFLVTMFAVALSFAPQLVSNSSAAGTYSAHADFADGRTSPLPWAENQG